jgi:conjugal transfer pilus assembly protein TraB
MKIPAPKILSEMDFSGIKNRQKYLLWGFGAFVIGGMLIYGWVSMRETSLTHKQEFKSSLLTGSSRINSQEAWVYQFKTEAEIAKKRIDTLEDMLSKLLKINKAPNTSSIGPSQTTSKNLPQEDTSPAALIESLRQDLKSEGQNSLDEHPSGRDLPGQDLSQAKNNPTRNGAVQASGVLPPAPGPFLPPPPGSLASETLSASTPPFRSKAVRKISLSLRNPRGNMLLKTVDNTVPAGAFAKAVLLGGVDASASIQASSDPRPALLRLTDAGTLPRKFRSDLKGCHALAACYGDISSERVFMRLEKLTCTERKTGEIVEVKVQGYVAGEDGRTGVRGTVVDRAGESMRNVLIGGFLGGIGEFLSQPQNAALNFSPMAGLGGLPQGGSFTQPAPMGMKDMIKHGAGKGINNALDKYADFYIKRAEQLQPVIQVAAGRQVDIVFTEGISMGESLYRQALGRSNDQGRYHDIAAVQQYQEPGEQP